MKNEHSEYTKFVQFWENGGVWASAIPAVLIGALDLLVHLSASGATPSAACAQTLSEIFLYLSLPLAGTLLYLGGKTVRFLKLER